MVDKLATVERDQIALEASPSVETAAFEVVGTPVEHSAHAVEWDASAVRKIHRQPRMSVGVTRALTVMMFNPPLAACLVPEGDEAVSRLSTARGLLTNLLDDVAREDMADIEASAFAVRLALVSWQGCDPYSGKIHSADDPELLTFMYACLVESQLVVAEHFGGWFSREERETYVAHMAPVAALLGLEANDIPKNVADLLNYLRAAPIADSPAALRAIGIMGLRSGVRRLTRVSLRFRVAAMTLPPHVRSMAGLPSSVSLRAHHVAGWCSRWFEALHFSR